MSSQTDAQGQTHPVAALMVGLLLVWSLDAIVPAASSATDSAPSLLVQRAGNTSSSHIGAAMAVLATLDQAQVLPPQGTKEADRMIQSVIQLQSLFLADTNPAAREFLRRALELRDDTHAAATLTRFRSSGWTSDVLSALAHAANVASPDELRTLESGLRSVNLSMNDFTRFMRLVSDSEQAFASTGQDFHEIFSSRRKAMPGAAAQ